MGVVASLGSPLSTVLGTGHRYALWHLPWNSPNLHTVPKSRSQNHSCRLREYYRSIPDMQRPKPIYDSAPLHQRLQPRPPPTPDPRAAPPAVDTTPDSRRSAIPHTTRPQRTPNSCDNITGWEVRDDHGEPFIDCAMQQQRTIRGVCDDHDVSRATAGRSAGGRGAWRALATRRAQRARPRRAPARARDGGETANRRPTWAKR